MDKSDGVKIINDLEKYKVFQEKINEEAVNGPKNKSLDWAQHYVRQFFGMKTDSFMMDLYLEIKHLGFFAEHITDYDDTTNSFEVQLRIHDLINSLIKYHDDHCKEDADNDES